MVTISLTIFALLRYISSILQIALDLGLARCSTRNSKDQSLAAAEVRIVDTAKHFRRGRSSIRMW